MARARNRDCQSGWAARVKTLLRVDRLEHCAGVPGSSVTDWRLWVDSLDTQAAWKVLGAVQRLAPSETPGGTDPGEALRVSLTLLDEELGSWLLRPIEIVEYFLASSAALRRVLPPTDWHWTEEHRKVWSDRHGIVAPSSAPRGVRALPLAAESLANVVKERLGPALPALFYRMASEPANAERVVGRVRRVCESVLGDSVEHVLGKAYEAFQPLTTIGHVSPRGNEVWRTEALRCVRDLVASLPEGLQEQEMARLSHLRGAIVSYKPVALIDRRNHGQIESVEFELGHFLNNWD